MAFSNGRIGRGGPAIFIDRDGVINRRKPSDYVLKWSEFVFTPGIRPALKRLASLRLPIILISNQAAVGKNLLDLAALEKITTQLYKALLNDNVSLCAAYYCPHQAHENCACRKPKPGLLLQAARDYEVNLSRSVFIGDAETDLQAARAAGCKPVWFGSGESTHSDTWRDTQDAAVASTADELFDVVTKCLQEP